MENEVSLIPREIRETGFPIARFLSKEEQARYEDILKKGKYRNKSHIIEEAIKLLKEKNKDER